MNAERWILLLCVLLVVGCAKRQGDTETTSSKPNADTPQAQSTAPATASQQTTPAPIRPSKLGDAARPLTSLTWVKGEPVEIKPGAVYVVEFWATWCPPCRVSIPHLTELQRKYKDKNVVIVGISQEKIDVVKPYVEQRGPEMDYAVAVDPQEIVTAGYMEAFGRNTIPTAFVVDAQGKIAWVGHPMDGLDAVLAKLVSGTPAAQGG